MIYYIDIQNKLLPADHVIHLPMCNFHFRMCNELRGLKLNALLLCLEIPTEIKDVDCKNVILAIFPLNRKR